MTASSSALRAAGDAERAAARLAWARAATGETALQLERASMDAGFRSYWRTQGAGPARIVMDSPPDLEEARPWLRIRALLREAGVRVPDVLAEDTDAGFLLLEDLGHRTCLDVVDDASADATFDAAFDQLLRLQAIACPDDLPAYDAPMLQRELDLFEDWFLGRHLGVALDADARAGLQAVQRTLVEAVLAQPQGFVHRDYMLRNLMPDGAGVAVIDFQGAVRGPLAYDPVSLFRDAFRSWPPARVDTWLARYHARARAAGVPVDPDPAVFARHADLAGMQRHLKILGLFARLHHRDGKPRYLADAPRFVGYLDQVLAREPALAPLAAILDRHVRPRLAAVAALDDAR
ncbi:phosphotransferase [Luteimonas sp. FCS-9]|uniref:aminoglycoside phosphotransferase family protein n=1 Tax=Luteimonas sp. FCS-9 TaxID=1547516 RepID=UPI00063EB650|nr:phosphotransferase [Luteimonas sp. FCS-9]KLI98498.1 aminoglycoside phosphotransferase [Luteimonas sp. FCS-9]